MEKVLSSSAERIDLLSASSLEDHPLRMGYYAEQHLERLLASIRADGLITPLVVWEISSENYRIIDGHYRVRALRRLGRKLIPSRITVGAEINSFKAYCTLHLLQRKLMAVEEAHMIERLVREGMTMKQIGEIFSHDKSWVSRRLSLLKRLNPVILGLLEKDQIRPRLAQELTKLSQDNGEQERVYKLIKRHSLTKDEAAEFILWWQKATIKERKLKEEASSLSLNQKQDTSASLLENWMKIVGRMKGIIVQQQIQKDWSNETWFKVYKSLQDIISLILLEKGSDIDA